MKCTAILLFLSIISQVDKTLGQWRCGAGFGDATCADGGFPGYCCSSSGYCGTTDACKFYYCDYHYYSPCVYKYMMHNMYPYISYNLTYYRITSYASYYLQ